MMILARSVKSGPGGYFAEDPALFVFSRQKLEKWSVAILLFAIGYVKLKCRVIGCHFSHFLLRKQAFIGIIPFLPVAGMWRTIRVRS